MKTIEITTDEQVMLASCLKLANTYQKAYMGDPDIRKRIKARIRLYRKMVKLYNIRANQY
jgi:hypothetical protein